MSTAIGDGRRPYMLAALDHHARTIIDIKDVRVGGARPAVMAGPCSIRDRDSLLRAAHAVRAAGANILRGGAFKPRSSPYAFQGLGEAGLRMLAETRAETGLPIVTEVMDTRQVELMRSPL